MQRALMTQVLMIFIAVNTQCGKTENPQGETKKGEPKIESRYVTAKGGLRMRDKPDTNGAVLETVPEGEQVKFIQEAGDTITISGALGKWTRIKWKEKEGWGFGGFLSNTKAESPAGSLIDKTYVHCLSCQDGPYFFMILRGDNTFQAVCNVSRLGRGEARGALREKYSGEMEIRRTGRNPEPDIDREVYKRCIQAESRNSPGRDERSGP